MFSCAHCWDNPCTCGSDYEGWSVKQLTDQITMLKKVLDKKIKAAREKLYESKRKRPS